MYSIISSCQVGLLCGLILSTALAQPFIKPVSITGTQKGDFVALQSHFDQWAQQQNLDSVRGWKWFKRWEQEMGSRANGDGSLPDQRILFREAIRLSRGGQHLPAARTANWSPVGPQSVPPSPDPNSIHGMGRINCVAFHPTDPNTLWVGVSQGGVWKSINAGASWMPLTDQLPILRISDIAVNPGNPDELYICVGDYAYLGVALDLDDRDRNTHYGLGVYKTLDGGQSWQATGLTFDQMGRDGSLTRAVLIRQSQAQELVAVGIHGIWKSYNSGASWVQKSDSVIWDLAQDPLNPDVLYASTGFVGALQAGSSGIWKSLDFGETWTKLPTGIPARDTVQRVEIAIAPSDPNYVYAISCQMADGFYGLYRSTDAGLTWTLRSDSSNSPNILHWSQGAGASGQGTYDLAIQVDPRDKEKVYIGGINIWGSADGGQSWQGCSYWRANFGPSLHADQHQFKFNPLDSLYYVCNDGGLYRTDQIRLGSWDSVFNDNYQWPTQWEDLSDGMQTSAFYRLGLSELFPQNLIAGAQDNATFFKQGQNWSNHFGGDGMNCLLHPSDPLIIYGSSQYGRILRSDNGGQSFSNLTFNINEQAEWTTPFCFHPDDPLILYAGYENLWESEDEGDSWIPISNFAPIPGLSFSAPASQMAIAPQDPKTIYLAKRILHSVGQPSELWKTNNRGQNWQNITAGLPDSLYFNWLAVSNQQADKVWLAVSGFVDGQKVYHSPDGGNSWQNISLNLPNLPANCLVLDTSTQILYLGMDIGIYYLEPGASSWQPYRDQLPNVIVTELEIHQASGKLYASTFGRGVWVSDVANLSSGPVPLLKQMHVKLHPNPHGGHFWLQIVQSPVNQLDMEVVDIMGRRVYARSLSLSQFALREEFDLKLAYGLYFLKLSHGRHSQVLRFQVDGR